MKSKFTLRILFFIFGSLFSNSLFSQIDKEFWFVVPEVTVNHGFPGGIPASLNFSTQYLPATVTISMPADPTNFPDVVINIPANSSTSFDLTNWIYTSSTEQNRLENKPLNASGINNFGLHITSTTQITANYSINNTWNTDLWVLKGKNALGIDFYTPFQTHGANGAYTAPDATAQPYSAIDIVATEDNTTIVVTPTKDASYGNAGSYIATNNTHTFILNKGQTLSIFPKDKNTLAANRLAGTHVSSNKPIAITLKDDSVIHPTGSCRDVVGDQLIPTDAIGNEYIVTRTFLNSYDYIYILATKPATPIYIDGVLKTILNVGQQYAYQFLTTAPNPFIRITSKLTEGDLYKPFYVFHVGGFECEQGAAILPPIDGCPGSSKITFNRSNSANLYLILLVRNGAQDGFKIDGEVRNDLIPPASFVLVPGTSWRVARLGPYSTTNIPTGTHAISNLKDLFQLGIINGDAGTTCRYGFFF